ncbi:prepilin-type N-terminal cleavage/methylation domain-containing protein [Candidatus Omnitrophota bacterium]
MKKGFTLVEVVIAAAVFAIAIVALLKVFIECSALADLARNTSFAVVEAQSKIEEIRSYSSSAIPAVYGPGGTEGDEFDLTRPFGYGKIFLTQISPSLLEVRVVVCWRNANNRVIGEDTNLDRTLAGLEDDGDGVLESLVTIATQIASR